MPRDRKINFLPENDSTQKVPKVIVLMAVYSKLLKLKWISILDFHTISLMKSDDLPSKSKNLQV